MRSGMSHERGVGGAGFEPDQHHVITGEFGHHSRTEGPSEGPENTVERTLQTQTVTPVTDLGRSVPHGSLDVEEAARLLREMAAGEADAERRAALWVAIGELEKGDR